MSGDFCGANRLAMTTGQRASTYGNGRLPF